MISIYKSTEFGLEKVNDYVNNCWINVVDPTPEEIIHLQGLGLPADFVTYPLDIDERSRTERDDDGKILIVLRIPYFRGENVDIPYGTIPLGIVMTDRHIFTICRYTNEIIDELSSGRMRGLSTGKRNRFVLRVLLATANKYLSFLREINRQVDEREDALERSMANKEVMQLLKYQKSLVYFTTALRSNELMLERLQRSQLFHMYADDEDLLDDVIIENQQAIEMTNISSNILSSMMDAFASIISNNLNVVMKFLTSVTIVMSIPTIITGFFGMNVDIPGATHSLAYMTIFLAIVMVSGVVVLIFNKRQWF